MLALALVLGTGVTATRAETPEEHNACANDAQRLCSRDIPDRDRVIACLLRSKPNLSRLCRSAMDREFRAGGAPR
jgi:hypothetical protein